MHDIPKGFQQEKKLSHPQKFWEYILCLTDNGVYLAYEQFSKSLTLTRHIFNICFISLAEMKFSSYSAFLLLTHRQSFVEDYLYLMKVNISSLHAHRLALSLN